LNNLANLYLIHDGDAAKARKYAVKAYSLRPDSPDVIDTLGLILLKEHKYSKAAELFQRALFFKPGSEEIQKHLQEAKNPAGRAH
jgi:uncharacterized protein HemY